MSSPQTGVDDVDVLTSLEARLGERNPDVAPDVIHALVQQAYARLTPAKVRTYLPVLILRQVQEDLRLYRATGMDVLNLPSQREPGSLVTQ